MLRKRGCATMTVLPAHSGQVHVLPADVKASALEVFVALRTCASPAALQRHRRCTYGAALPWQPRRRLPTSLQTLNICKCSSLAALSCSHWPAQGPADA